jgi:hypothetical protein
MYQACTNSYYDSVQQAKQMALLESRKLALVLDLDHTLLHAVAIAALPTNMHMLEVLGVNTLTLLDTVQPAAYANPYFEFDPLSHGNTVIKDSNTTVARHHLIKLRPGKN